MYGMTQAPRKYKEAARAMFALFFLSLVATIVLVGWGIATFNSTDIDSPQRNTQHQYDTQYIAHQDNLANNLMWSAMATSPCL